MFQNPQDEYVCWKGHVVMAISFGDKCEIEALKEQNASLLHDFEGVAPDDEMTNSVIMK